MHQEKNETNENNLTFTTIRIRQYNSFLIVPSLERGIQNFPDKTLKIKLI